MGTLFDSRRYLTDFDSARTGHVFTDTLVIGSGVAGARAAIEAARFGDVILITKGTLEDSVTMIAQGGVAAVTGEDDSVEAHAGDTLEVGAGLAHADVVKRTVQEGPERIQELIGWGARFDMTGEELALGREGGHHRRRILHAQGDATGREVSRVLFAKLRDTSAIRTFEHCFLIDLITVDDRCVGAATFNPKYGHQLLWAGQFILATGGAGRLYRETTNPEIATGDGLAVAFRAGVKLRDMELVQFHPTTLYVAGSSRALISEAVRGEGAHLVDRDGERFMFQHHADGELAPRDVVSRAIQQALIRTGATCVYVDVRHIPKPRFAERFPRITQLCEDFGIDVATDLIPVRPSAHYLVGGVVVDAETRTSLNGLLCCGEAASTGLHGANRLASNSLLEGLVFGAAAGQTAGRLLPANRRPAAPAKVKSENPVSRRTLLDLDDVRDSLRSLMWRNVGIERTGDLLAETVEIIEFWGRFVLDKTFDEPAGWETQNMLTVGRLVASGALHRTESRGVHFRSDHSTVSAADTPAYHLTQQRCGSHQIIERTPKS